MRSIRLLAAATFILALGTGCGGGNVEPNTPPTAAFTAPTCTVGTACAFTADPSSDDNAVTGWNWDFNGDATADATTKDASFTFAAAGSIPVRLIVSDAAGLADTVINNVPVAPGTPGNTPPVANFDLPTCTAGTPCGFHSTSTDADGTIVSTDWDFGDTGTGEGADVTHTYAAAGTFNVTMLVTDNGGATGTATKSLTVSPAASQDCTTTDTVVDCSLSMTSRVTVKVIMASRACELAGNKLSATAPVAQTIFFNLCNRPLGEEYTIKDGTGATLVFTAGSSLGLRFQQGTAGPLDPPTGDPGIRIQGQFPTWTLNVDDGGAAGTGGEPDFDDVVLTVQATLAP